MTTETTVEAREWRIGGAVQRWPPDQGPHRIWIDEVGDRSSGFGARWVAEARTRAEAEQMIRRHNSHDALVAALEGMLAVYGDPCRTDHEGYCQAHNLGRPCEVAAARLALTQAYGETE